MEHLAVTWRPECLSSRFCCTDFHLLEASSSGRPAGCRPRSRISITGVRASTQNFNGTASDENGRARFESGNNYRGKLRLFIDSADLDTWRHWLPSGAFYGVTTNPILLEKARVTCQVKSMAVLANRAFQLGAKEVQMQTWGRTVRDMVNTGTELANISPSIVVQSIPASVKLEVKIPITKHGLEAATRLINRGARVTMTGVYSTHQALLAAGVGAAYAAPYLGRMVALGKSGMEDILEMQRIVSGVRSDMRLLVASIKSMEQLTSLAARGVNSFAVPVPIIEELFQDPDTETAAAAFEEAVSRNSFRLFS